ncbi:hypothetical protein Mal48_24550 [Thalassoglobus polymorphus]|uniref:Uncharacterized protein n=1 Tax=Thalassoglobus polymorphus TaxID=2527994 RepID=A0A517QNJ8_9PLAN|nr:hypothetical protein Mal48_24550 [Thalassoglobus polymorphus]
MEIGIVTNPAEILRGGVCSLVLEYTHRIVLMLTFFLCFFHVMFFFR